MFFMLFLKTLIIGTWPRSRVRGEFNNDPLGRGKSKRPSRARVKRGGPNNNTRLHVTGE